MRHVRRYTASLAQTQPVILGGDFNTPAGDSLYSIIKPGLRDVFPLAGRGWPDTCLNDFPASRIDVNIH